MKKLNRKQTEALEKLKIVLSDKKNIVPGIPGSIEGESGYIKTGINTNTLQSLCVKGILKVRVIYLQGGISSDATISEGGK